MKFTFHQDPGHGWLQVPLIEIARLGIGPKISRYSYLKGDSAYLEEDCDAPMFAKAFERAGGTLEIEAIEHADRCPIRGYGRFRAVCPRHDFCLIDDEGVNRCSKCGEIDPKEND